MINVVTKRKEGAGEHAPGSTGKPTTVWRVYVNGQKTNLLLVFDRIEREWDLCTEGHYIASASSLGALMQRLDILTRELLRGASLAVNPPADEIDDLLAARKLENQP